MRCQSIKAQYGTASGSDRMLALNLISFFNLKPPGSQVECQHPVATARVL